MFSYTVLVCTALAGLLGAPWWLALITGSAVSLSSIRQQQKLRARFAAVDALDVLAVSGLASLATGCLAAAAAFALGRLVGVLFQAL